MPRSTDDTIILVVDDSASVRKLVELTLRRDRYSVIGAASGIAALAALSENSPDLVLLDVMLESLNGFQICRAIRNHPDLATTPIVILSGREGESDRKAGAAAGVNAYLTKPFRPEELLRTIATHLQQPVETGQA